MEAARNADIHCGTRKGFLGHIHARHEQDDRCLAAVWQQMKQTGDGLAVVERHFNPLDRMIGHLAAAIDHLGHFLVEIFLDRMIVKKDRMLCPAIRFNRLIVVIAGGFVGAQRVRAFGEFFVPLRRFAPHFGQHAIVARTFAGRHFQIITFEILHPTAHIQRQIQHPLLVVTLCSQFAYHDLSSSIDWSACFYCFAVPLN